MGKLVLTRRAGESVIVREANGKTWNITVAKLARFVTIEVTSNWTQGAIHDFRLLPTETISFAGGSVELRPARCPSQAILAFDFPRDVTILRTEIA